MKLLTSQCDASNCGLIGMRPTVVMGDATSDF